MIYDLWMLILFLASGLLNILGWGAISIIYFELASIRRPRKIQILKGLGSIFIGFTFVMSIVSKINSGLDLSFSFVEYVLLAIGIILLIESELAQPFPIVPKLSGQRSAFFSTKSLHNFLNFLAKNNILRWLLLLLILPITPVSSLIMLGLKIFEVRSGWNKQDRIKLVSWLIIFIFSIFMILDLTLANIYPQIMEFVKTGSTFWLINQSLLILLAVTISIWINQFLSFRIKWRLGIAIWQIVIVAALVFTVTFAGFSINNTRTEVSRLMSENINQLDFNLAQAKTNANDFANVLAINPTIVAATASNDQNLLNQIIKDNINNNNSVNQVLIRNSSGEIIFNNLVSDPNINLASDNTDFSIISQSNTSNMFVIKSIVEVTDNRGNIVGDIVGIKFLDDGYFDQLKSDSNQEYLVYINGRRSASTLFTEDENNREENIPIINSNNNIDNINLEGEKYFIETLEINEVAGEEIIIITAQPEFLIYQINRNIVLVSFLVAIIFCIATVPIITWLSIKLNEDSKA